MLIAWSDIYPFGEVAVSKHYGGDAQVSELISHVHTLLLSLKILVVMATNI